MLNGNEHKWHVLRPGHFDVAPGLGQLSDAIRQEVAQSVARNHKDRQIDHSLEQFLPEVNQIHRQHIASAGNLDLDANAYVARPSVDGLLFDPIDAARFLLGPSAGSLELGIDQDPKDLAAIRVFAFFNEKLEAGDELPNLI